MPAANPPQILGRRRRRRPLRALLTGDETDSEPTVLTPAEEKAFQVWAVANGIGPSPDEPYDYRGHWRTLAALPPSTSSADPFSGGVWSRDVGQPPPAPREDEKEKKEN